jgi:hypothetical protein
VARWTPEDTNVVGCIERALSHKYKSLSNYKNERGAITVLILESSDISLTNHIHLYKAFIKAYRRVAIPNVDQIWLARTYDPENLFKLFCFFGPKSVCEKANPQHSMFGPHHADYWNSVVPTVAD